MATLQHVNDFLDQKRLAVIGVSPDTSKYGWIVYRHLQGRGYQVFAVNPKYDEIHGEPCYRGVAAVPEPVTAAVLIVPPAVTASLVPELVAAGITALWLQPGAESPAAIAAAEAAGLVVIHSACIMQG